jgi:hypothetical protein
MTPPPNKTPRTTARFVQITTCHAHDARHTPVVTALDEDGNVWSYVYAVLTTEATDASYWTPLRTERKV